MVLQLAFALSEGKYTGLFCWDPWSHFVLVTYHVIWGPFLRKKKNLLLKKTGRLRGKTTPQPKHQENHGDGEVIFLALFGFQIFRKTGEEEAVFSKL